MGKYSDEELMAWIKDEEIQSRASRLRRLRFLTEEFDEGYRLSPGIALVYEEEAKLSFYHGAFISTIVLVQMAIEETIRATLHDAGLDWAREDKSIGFFKLTEEAFDRKLITRGMRDSFHRLRSDVRNKYMHPGSWEVGLDLGRFPERGIAKVEEEARFAIRVMADTLRQGLGPFKSLDRM